MDCIIFVLSLSLFYFSQDFAQVFAILSADLLNLCLGPWWPTCNSYEWFEIKDKFNLILFDTENINIYIENSLSSTNLYCYLTKVGDIWSILEKPLLLMYGLCMSNFQFFQLSKISNGWAIFVVFSFDMVLVMEKHLKSVFQWLENEDGDSFSWTW